MKETSNTPGYESGRSGQEAFQKLVPVRPDYQAVSVQDGFNWSECAAWIETPQLYLVVFRSVRREGADLEKLTAYDDRAHAEAAAKPGFLHYFKGQATEGRECLSFCLWESQEAARETVRGSAHSMAMALVDEAYESYRLERYLLEKSGMKPDKELVFRSVPGAPELVIEEDQNREALSRSCQKELR